MVCKTAPQRIQQGVGSTAIPPMKRLLLVDLAHLLGFQRPTLVPAVR